MDTIKRALAVILTAVFLTFAIMPTMVDASGTAFPAREVKVLILHDDSFRGIAREAGIPETEIEHRFKQMMKLAETPFKSTWNISFDVTVATYESVFGAPYSYDDTSCLWEWESPGEGLRLIRNWNENSGICSCTDQCFSDVGLPGHHTALHQLKKPLEEFVINSTEYDVAVAYVGHRLCYVHLGEHKVCKGMSTYDPHSSHFVARGTDKYSFSGSGQDPVEMLNFFDLRALFCHEYSHSYTLDDHSCTVNEACIMTGAFDNFVYVENMWCTYCTSIFQYDQIGTVLGGNS